MKMFTALSVLGLLVSCSQASVAKEYYVDYSTGNDSASGTTPNTPWKHAPGDPEAAGVAAATLPVAGDIIRFKGGVAYRGQIDVNANGAAGNPITFSGTGYGTGSAIIDGADPVDMVIPCPSQAACGGATNWTKLSLITFTPPKTRFIKLYGSSGLLFEAQSPVPPDAFFGDDVATYAVSKLSDKALIESGRLPSPALAALLGGSPAGQLLIWVRGNQVVRRAVTGVDGEHILFTPNGIELYADRSGRYALLGTVHAVTAPGQYAVTDTGRAVAWLPDSSPVEVGDGRSGIDVLARQHIAIKGFIFRHQTAASDARAEGAPISRARTPSGSGLLIEGNRFEDMALWDGKGAISLSYVSDVIIRNNVFSMIERGSGMRLSTQTRDVTVENNLFDGIGRTGIGFFETSDSVIRGNVMTNMRGVHGNGISLYLVNRRIQVVDNRIDATTRPMTFHGDKTTTASGDHDFIIDRNIFLATSTAQAALTSWGASTRNVSITNNVLIAPKGGLLTNDSDTGVVITGNYVSGIIHNDVQRPEWIVANNKTAPKTLLTLPTNAAGIEALCTGASVPSGKTLGGYTC